MEFVYDWEDCMLLTDEWRHMLERRNKAGWRMVSASVSTAAGQPVAYVFWETQVKK